MRSNPAAVEGQIHGGVTQGLGWALFEGLEHDEDGQLLTATLMDYALPHSYDVPNIQVILVEVPIQTRSVWGQGCWRATRRSRPATIANALYDAVGVRVAEIPVTPERMYRALRGIAQQ